VRKEMPFVLSQPPNNSKVARDGDFGVLSGGLLCDSTTGDGEELLEETELLSDKLRCRGKYGKDGGVLRKRFAEGSLTESSWDCDVEFALIIIELALLGGSLEDGSALVEQRLMPACTEGRLVAVGLVILGAGGSAW
jgi:hypothetical protein